MRRFSLFIALKRIIIYTVTIALLFAILIIGREYWPDITKRLRGIPTEKEVTISTERRLYSEGEKVTITVKNNTASEIFYAQRAECGASSWILEDCLGNEVAYYQTCLWETYQHRFTRLEPGETLRFTWAGTAYHKDGTIKGTKWGCYKVVFPYSLKKKTAREGWRDDKREATSGMFLIK
jgi:hypothetical protein